jgi:uncharacterized membrane protein YdjX (TVP38/TMEM64 family)
VLETVRTALAMLDGNSLALLACYVGLHVLFAVLCLPCSPFTFIAGSLWGIWPGMLISSVSALLAAAATFAIGRSALGRAGSDFVSRWSILRRAMEGARNILGMGWESVVLVQGNPLVPASSLGYVFGMTRIRPRTFLLTTYLATLPLQAVLVATGALARDAILLRQVQQVVVFSMIAATALLGIWILVRRRLRRASTQTAAATAAAEALLAKGNGNAE